MKPYSMTDAEPPDLSLCYSRRGGPLRLSLGRDMHDDDGDGASSRASGFHRFCSCRDFGACRAALLATPFHSSCDCECHAGCRERSYRALQREPEGPHRPSRERGQVASAGECPQRSSALTARVYERDDFTCRLNWARGLTAAGAMALLPLPGTAAAQVQYSAFCGVTGDATAPVSITYDPFSPRGLSEATIPLILQRTRNLVGGRTNNVSLILTAPADTPPLTITYRGQNVLYREGATAGRPRGLGGHSPGEIRFQFGGLFSTDLSSPLDLRVSVPPGTDLSAGEPVYLDMIYICDADGAMLPILLPTRLSRAVRLDVNVVSALQAYYAGSALDFGEIGDITTQQVQADPDRYTTAATNSLRVRSSGPFQVQVRSQNDFRLTYPGGNTGIPAQTIRYTVRFLGQDIASNGAFGSRICERAGVGGAGGMLPIQARLTEGGAGKTPSPNYADRVTVTFTPIVTASAAQTCAGL